MGQRRGSLSHTIADAALTLEIIAGEDEYDSTVSKRPVEKYSQEIAFNKKAKIGYFKETLDSDAINGEVKEITLVVLLEMPSVVCS